jgi:hypothetical protein
MELETGKEYRVSAKKADGKWWSFGNLKVNSYGNWQIGIKKTDELRELFKQSGEWINFSIYPKDDEQKPQQRQPEPRVEETDEIPF